MRKIAVALSKGGVGKTTTAVNLAAGLARMGNRVLLIDVDTQGQVAKSLGSKPDIGLAELVSGEATSDQACVLARENLWLLCGGSSLVGLKRLITRKDYGGEQTFTETLHEVEEQFDFIVLDTAPGWDALTVNALFYAEDVLSPVSLEVMTLQGLIDFTHSMASIQRYHPQLTLRYVVPTFFDRRVKKSAEIAEQLHQHYAAVLCEPVRYNVRLSEAPGYGQSIFEYAPGSTGAQDYQKLAERVLHDKSTR